MHIAYKAFQEIIRKFDDLSITPDGHDVKSDNADDGEEEEEEDTHRHSDDDIMTKIEYDSQAILDLIGAYTNEHHDLCQQSKERGIPHVHQDETWDCGTYYTAATTGT